MTGSYRLVLGAGAALALLVAAAPDLRAQQFTGTTFTTPSLFATVTLGAATSSGSGIGYANPQDRFCGSPFDVRFGSWSPWYGTRWSAVLVRTAVRKPVRRLVRLALRRVEPLRRGAPLSRGAADGLVGPVPVLRWVRLLRRLPLAAGPVGVGLRLRLLALPRLRLEPEVRVPGARRLRMDAVRLRMDAVRLRLRAVRDEPGARPPPPAAPARRERGSGRGVRA
jgi:hypothetical protein